MKTSNASGLFNLISLLISIILWFVFAISLTSVIHQTLLSRNFPQSGLFLTTGYVFWGLFGILPWFKIRKTIFSDKKELPFIYLLFTSLLFLIVILMVWLSAFHFGGLHRRLFLFIHIFGSFFVLFAQLSFHKSFEHLNDKITRLISPTAFSLFGNIALGLISLMIFSILLEGSFTLVSGLKPAGRLGEYGATYDFVLSPYLMFAEPEGERMNSQGFYGAELEEVKKSTEKRIAIIGGSVVWAGSPLGPGEDNTSIAYYLQKLLEKQHPQYQITVMNFGRQSYVSMQELILLERSILPLDMDLVIVFDGFNDIWIPLENEPVGHPYLYSNLKRITEMDLTTSALSNLARDLKKHSALFFFFSGKLSDTGTRETQESFNIEAVLEEYERNLFQMAVLCNAYKAHILFATQPFVGTKVPLTSSEMEHLDNQTLEMLRGYYKKLTDSARVIAGNSGTNYVDATKVFNGMDKDIFNDPVHIRRYGGNPIVAERLAREIIRLDLLN